MSARRRQRAEEAEATPLAPEADDTLPAAAPPETSDAQRLSPAAAEHLFPERRPPTAFERLFAAVNGAVRPQPPKARHEIASSTLLQQLVCANSVLSALWAAGWICLFLWKASVWEPPLHVVILSPTLYIAWAVFEPIRLTLGCLGNLHERIELLGPFMFSTLAVAVIHVYFLTAQHYLGWITLQVEYPMSALLLCIYVAELVVGWPTARLFILKAEANFQLVSAGDLDER